MEEEQGSGAEWYDEWHQSSPDDWLNDDWSLEEQDWSGEWIGSVDDWSGDWSWFEDDWSSWPEDWSWNTQEWWNPTEAQPQSSMVPRPQVRMSLRTPPRMNHHRMCQL